MPAQPVRTSRVTNGEVGLAVSEYGERDSDVHVVALHGFPDDQQMWGPVIERLDPSWHVVTYDSRGAGGSSRPSAVGDYRAELLVEDFVAVLRETVPEGSAVHLVGHDWGSIIGWEVVAAQTWDRRLAGRVASYTSASGPPLDHLGTLSSTPAGRLRMLPQAVHSWYVWATLLPKGPEFAWRRLQPALRAVVGRIDPTILELPWGDRVAANAVPALNLYRANVLRRMRHPVPWRTSIPVQLVVALRDGFVTPRSLDGLEARCRRLTRVEVDEGHWLPRTRPAEFADLVTRLVWAQEAS